MIYLILSVIASTLVFVIFQLFGKFEVNNLKAIIVNYFTAHLIGAFIAGGYNPGEIITANWLPVALGMGLLFISLFNLMAHTAQNNGVSVASVANKMSVVIPVVIAILFHNEGVTLLKSIGIGLACIGVWMTSVKQDNVRKNASIWFPLILFIGSGILDTILNYSSKELLNGNEDIYSSMIFLFAGTFGLFFLAYKKDLKFSSKDILWGVTLGVINYFSIYLVLMALKYAPWESSVVFPVNNMSIVAVSTIISWSIFKESMSLKNWIGIVVSILAILIITWYE